MVSYCQAARIDTQDKENGADSSQMYLRQILQSGSEVGAVYQLYDYQTFNGPPLYLVYWISIYVFVHLFL